jgi:hypothetical protein
MAQSSLCCCHSRCPERENLYFVSAGCGITSKGPSTLCFMPLPGRCLRPQQVRERRAVPGERLPQRKSPGCLMRLPTRLRPCLSRQQMRQGAPHPYADQRESLVQGLTCLMGTLRYRRQDSAVAQAGVPQGLRDQDLARVGTHLVAMSTAAKRIVNRRARKGRTARRAARGPTTWGTGPGDRKFSKTCRRPCWPWLRLRTGEHAM